MQNFGMELKIKLKKINDKPGGKYTKDFTKIKFNSDDDLILDKPLKFHNLTIVV